VRTVADVRSADGSREQRPENDSFLAATRVASIGSGLQDVRTTPSRSLVSMGIGAALREAREGQGRSLEDVAGRLRARVSQLEALEDEQFGDFGGDVYARGFLRSYATDLGLDPAPLLETYRREVEHDDALPMNFATSVNVKSGGRQRSAPPAWMAWVLVAVVVLAGVAVVGSIDGGRTPEQASVSEPPPAPAPSGRDDAADGDGDDVTGDDPDESPPGDDTADGNGAGDAPEPEPEAEVEGVDLLLALEADSWMRVIVDGSVLLEQIVDAGETLQFPGDREIEVRYGNAGGVRATLNGEDLGVQGASGQAITVRYTEDGFEEA
jgi:cytoskeleton protein RodZ